MFKGHPKGLFALALANTGERFGYYTMLAVFALFLRENFGLAPGAAGAIYSTFLGLVYFMPLIGGILADKFGFGKMVTIGITVMFLGYLLLAVPLGGDTLAMVVMIAALLFISLGTGLFKGNLQVMVGNLYDDPKYADRRDSAFSLFYMAINVGSLFAPTAALSIKAWAENSLGFSGNDAYHFSFAVACVSLILSMAIYYAFRYTFKHVEGGERKKGDTQVEDNLTPEETKSRITALILVFAVVIFFWMAFHQNGLTLTYFADEFTETSAVGATTMLFDVWNLALIIVAVYATFAIFQSEKAKGKITAGAIATAVLAYLTYRMTGSADAKCAVDAPIFQQFNPFYVVALTPVSMAIFGALAKKGKEPSAPRKIAYGMLVAAIGFAIMAVGSADLNTPEQQTKAIAVSHGQEYSKTQFDSLGITENIEKVIEKTNNEIMAMEQLLSVVRNIDNVSVQVKDIDSTKYALCDQFLTDSLYQEFKGSLAITKCTGDRSIDTVGVNANLEALNAYKSRLEEIGKTQSEYVESLTKSEKTEELELFYESLNANFVVLASADDEAVATAKDTLNTLNTEHKETRTSSYWLIFTYLILTFAELLLSPMGISFVSKVAPPKYKGMMMGGWFVATAIGNFLVSVGGFLWGGLPLWSVWAVFIGLCLLSALFMFVMMKKLEDATK